MARSKESQDERYVREMLEQRFGVTLRKLEESTEDGVKSADFELLSQDERVAVMEVKTLELTPRTVERGFREENGFLTRPDNAPKRVAARIHGAWQQLRVYPESIAKVAVFVNDETAADVLDLSEAFQGFLDYDNPETGVYRNTVSRRLANGRMRDEKGRIDLYLWFDRHYGTGQEVRLSRWFDTVSRASAPGALLPLQDTARLSARSRVLRLPRTDRDRVCVGAPRFFLSERLTEISTGDCPTFFERR